MNDEEGEVGEGEAPPEDDEEDFQESDLEGDWDTVGVGGTMPTRSRSRLRPVSRAACGDRRSQKGCPAALFWRRVLGVYCGC